MKKKLTTSLSAIIVLFTASHAQIQKGEKTIGGIIGFNSRSSSYLNGYNTKYSWVNLTPKLGFPLGHSWRAGPLVGFRYYKEEVNGPTTVMSSSHVFQGGGFIRKSCDLTKRLGVFLEGETGYGIGKTVYFNSANGTSSQTNLKLRQFAAVLKPGLYFKPGDRFIIEASIGQVGFSQNTSIDATGYRSTSRFFDASLKNNFGFGVQFILKK